MSAAVLFPLLSLPCDNSSVGLLFTCTTLVQRGSMASIETLGFFWLSRAGQLISFEFKSCFNSVIIVGGVMSIGFGCA